MKNSIVKLFTLLGCLSVLGSACQREELLPETGTEVAMSEAAKTKIKDQYKHAKIVTYAHDALYAQLQSLSTGGEIMVDFPNLGGGAPLSLHLRRNGVVEDGFRATLSDGKSLSSTPDLGIRTFEGTVNGGGIVALTISSAMLAGTLEYNGETWMLDPGQQYDRQAKHTIVAYRESDMPQYGTLASSADPNLPSSARLVDPSMQPTPLAANCWQVDVLVHGDFAFLLRMGGDYNAAVFSLVNAVNVSNSRFTSINIHLRIPSGNVIQNSQVDNLSSNVETLLNQVVLYDNSLFASFPRDLSMMYTGLDLRTGSDNSPVNNCNPWTLCSSPSTACGIAETINGWYNTRIQTSMIAAILGATGDFACNQSLMYPTYWSSCAGEQLSQFSKDQINFHIWTNHNCIAMAPGC